jgi:hypothetical protein
LPGRSKFTSPRKARILEVIAAGGSRRAAAAGAGIDHATLSRWLERGRRGAEGGTWRTFLEAVEQAEIGPHLVALKRDLESWEERPDLAWKFLERREFDFSPPHPDEPEGPTVIHLTFFPKPAPSPKPGDDNDDYD